MGNTVTVNGCEVDVVKGLLQECKEDAIVNSTSEDLDLQKNASAKALGAAAGPMLQLQCSLLKPLKLGEVKVSDSFNLSCKNVLHCWIDSEQDIEKAIMECLRIVDQDLGYESVAFPALGTGKLKKEAFGVAQCFLRCIGNYTSANKVRSLRRIRIILYPSDASIYKEFKLVFMKQKVQMYNKDPKDSQLESNKTVIQHGMKFMNVAKDLKCNHLYMKQSSMEHSSEDLDHFSEEFWDVQANFAKTFTSSSVRVLQIKRVHISDAWTKYKTYRQQVSNKLHLPQRRVERTVWHGTSEDIASEIAQFSFNRCFQGQNATPYGKGCYFTCDSSFSDTCTTPNYAGEKFVIQARVVVGRYTLGNPNLIVAPVTASGETYDSVVDDVEDPTIFVVFNDASAYPEYIIKYLTY